MASNGRKYEENLTMAIRSLRDSNNGNHRKIKCNAADRRASGHTLGLNPVPNHGKGTVLISSRAIIGSTGWLQKLVQLLSAGK